jgi:TonB family protein
MRIRLACVGTVVLATTLALPRAASAQVQTSAETQFAQRAAQSPHDISALLDLAKFYFDQHRYDDASRTLSRAMAVIQQEQLLVVPATTPAAAAPVVAADLGQPLRVGGDLKEPKRIKYVEPIYPPGALAARAEGYVVLEAVVGPDGRVHSAKVLKGHPLFDAAAMDAVLHWAYTPTTVSGVPVSVIMDVTVMFRLQ